MINTLPDVVSASSVALFADDTLLLRISDSDQSEDSHLALLQQDVACCESWAANSSAVYNPGKSAHIAFQSSCSRGNSSNCVQVSGVALQQKSSQRHIGVTLTPNLSFDSHISGLLNKYRCRVFLLAHMSKVVPYKVLALLYKCYVRPTIEYALPVWLLALNSKQRAALDQLQATAARSFFFVDTNANLTG